MKAARFLERRLKAMDICEFLTTCSHAALCSKRQLEHVLHLCPDGVRKEIAKWFIDNYDLWTVV